MKSVAPSRWPSALSASESCAGQERTEWCAPRKRLHRGARAIRGQLQRGGRALELPPPVGELRLQRLALEPLAAASAA